MNNEIEIISKKIKDNIQLLINANKLKKALELIDEYLNLSRDDVEAYSIKAVLLMIQGLIDDAEITLRNGLIFDKNNFDLLYNLAYVYENSNRYLEAIRIYKIAKENCSDNNSIQEINSIILKINEDHNDIVKRLDGRTNYNIAIYTSNLKDENIDKVKNIFNVMGYINNKFIDDKIVSKIDKNNLKLLNLDYIIIFEENRDNAKHVKEELSKYISAKKIYDYYEYTYPICTEGFEYKFDELLRSSNIELLVTGLSYAETAIDCDLLNLPSFNFALSSQDLFYDYNIFKYLISLKHIKNSLKYCIIGLAYYSFDYDLSKSNEATRVHRYIPLWDIPHDYLSKPQLSIIHYDYLKTNYKNDYLSLSNAKRNTIMYDDNKEAQNHIAVHHAEMNHPETVVENKKILKNYFDLLKANNIKPIIVICPTNKNHYQHFKNGILKNRFYNILNEFKSKYNFQILDYFDSNLFVDCDFWDYSHLNKKGSKKFTQILNEKIIW